MEFKEDNSKIIKMSDEDVMNIIRYTEVNQKPQRKNSRKKRSRKHMKSNIKSIGIHNLETNDDKHEPPIKKRRIAMNSAYNLSNIDIKQNGGNKCTLKINTSTGNRMISLRHIKGKHKRRWNDDRKKKNRVISLKHI